jgi:hypothetical protein
LFPRIVVVYDPDCWTPARFEYANPGGSAGSVYVTYVALREYVSLNTVGDRIGVEEDVLSAMFESVTDDDIVRRSPTTWIDKDVNTDRLDASVPRKT